MWWILFTLGWILCAALIATPKANHWFSQLFAGLVAVISALVAWPKIGFFAPITKTMKQRVELASKPVFPEFTEFTDHEKCILVIGELEDWLADPEYSVDSLRKFGERRAVSPTDPDFLSQDQDAQLARLRRRAKPSTPGAVVKNTEPARMHIYCVTCGKSSLVDEVHTHTSRPSESSIDAAFAWHDGQTEMALLEDELIDLGCRTVKCNTFGDGSRQLVFRAPDPNHTRPFGASVTYQPENAVGARFQVTLLDFTTQWPDLTGPFVWANRQPAKFKCARRETAVVHLIGALLLKGEANG